MDITPIEAMISLNAFIDERQGEVRLVIEGNHVKMQTKTTIWKDIA